MAKNFNIPSDIQGYPYCNYNMKLYNQDELHPSFIKVFCLKCCVLICLYYCITVLLDFWNVFRWEITFVTFSASQYIFFVSADSALSSTSDLGASDIYNIEEICLSDS